MISWKNLPISFLGRINLIKMAILPKIIYPVSMLFVFLKSNDIRDINKAKSDFMWAGRKPKIKLDILQLPKEGGGGVYLRLKIIYCPYMPKLLLMDSWTNWKSWIEIEATFCKPFSPVNLLDKQGRELPIIVNDNLLITNIIKAWSSLRKIFKKIYSLNSLTTLVDNPDLTAEGSIFKTWQEAGIKSVWFVG